MKKTLIMTVIVAVLVGGLSFYGGMKYDQSKVSARRAQVANISEGFRNGGGRQGSGFASGQIISRDDKSITIKLVNGGSQIVFLSGATHVGKSVDGSVTDLTNGTQVLINGSSNSDGSITAQSIQIGGLMGFGRGQQEASPSPSSVPGR